MTFLRRPLDVEPDKPAAKSRITLSDIALAAGVSRATVSLVLRNSPTIPRRTHEHVLRHAADLGYVYNRAAAALRTGGTHIIGLAIHDITNPYFTAIAAAVQRELRVLGRMAFLGDSGDTPDLQRAFVEAVREYNVDGIIISPSAGTDPAWIARLREWRLPCVMVSRSLPGVEVDFVGGDNFGGMRRQTAHLLELGHRRIAMIGVNETISTGRERLAGYRAALAEAGIPPDPSIEIACPGVRKAGHDALIQLLRDDDPPTAFVCFNDITAFGVMLGLQSLGLKAGQDISVVGFDDVEESVLWRPALSTEHVSCDAIGVAAVRLLMRRIADPDAPVERVVIAPEQRIRQTTMPPPSRQRLRGMIGAARQWTEPAR
ncbi:LacI family DNA-binding transcriptional regulator [Geminicoccus roseus]|uniref:LacI family DNA-binding transcriptional regulator n=1 Tax=Geminicoccus roseus TaxID=404900 RepID=UPI000419023A|nr:LacI family DNA-binding transcriptional regulator [Geminicoccus roseus]